MTETEEKEKIGRSLSELEKKINPLEKTKEPFSTIIKILQKRRNQAQSNASKNPLNIWNNEIHSLGLFIEIEQELNNLEMLTMEKMEWKRTIDSNRGRIRRLFSFSNSKIAESEEENIPFLSLDTYSIEQLTFISQKLKLIEELIVKNVGHLYEEWTNKITITSNSDFYYSLLTAPSGYGKTLILNFIRFKQEENGWLNIHIELDRNKSKVNFEDIKQLLINIIQKEYNPSELTIGTEIAPLLIKRCQEEEKKEGVFLTIDNIDLLDIGDHYNITKLSENAKGISAFINDLRERLDEATMKLAIVLSGRYLKDISNFGLTGYNYILDTMTFERTKAMAATMLKLYKPTANFSEKKKSELASYLMALTGGHPGAMSSILQDYRLGEQIEHLLDEFKRNAYYKRYNDYVEELKESIKKYIPDLFETLYYLSPIRQFEASHVLSQLILKKAIPFTDRPFELERKLRYTNFFKRNDHGFLSDCVTGRLLAACLRKERDRFEKIRNAALDIYKELFSMNNDAIKIQIACEICFLYVQYASYDERKDKLQTFSNIKEVYTKLVEKQETFKSATMNAFKTVLDKDWEFQFTLNYVCRNEKMDSTPYTELQQEMNIYLETLLKSEEEQQ